MSVSVMKKLTVLTSRTDADAVVRRLMRLRCVEISRTAPDPETGVKANLAPDSERGALEKAVARASEAIAILAPYSRRKKSLVKPRHEIDRDEFVKDHRYAAAKETVERVFKAQEALRENKAALEKNGDLISLLSPWVDYDMSLSERTTKRAEAQLGSILIGAGFSALEAACDEIGAYAELVSFNETTYYVSVWYLREDAAEVAKVLNSFDFVKANFKDADDAGTTGTDTEETPARRITVLQERQMSLEGERSRIVDELHDYAERLDDLEIYYDIEATTLNSVRQQLKLGATECCCLLSGWVPAERENAVSDALEKFECAYEMNDPGPEEEPPVLLKNNRFAQNFEWVIGMYSYPKYGSYDPSFIMGIFYFIIFGLMFADVGYGLLLTAACFGGIKLLKPKDSMKRMLLMFGYCGISCILMGVLFGGWFGNMPTAIMNSFIYHEAGYAETTALGRFFSEGIIMNPITSSTAFLVLAIGFGELHLIVGMAINMIETWKKGERLSAVCTTLPYWVFFAGVDLLAPSFVSGMIYPEGVSESAAATMAQLSDIGLYLLFGGMALILLCKGLGQKSFAKWLTTGLGGLYSLISFASDLLSYSRILALGLVAGVIAQVINMLSGLGATGVIGFIVMVIVMVLGHVLNLAINLLGTFVHAARLQYIEFFGKFYEDGGKPFDPALPSENYSEDVHNVPN